MKIKVFEAFAGYGSQMMALRRVARRHAGGTDFQLVGWSEIDDNAIAAHNAVFPEYAECNHGDISKVDWERVSDFDLFTYSFPCQDISNAGLQRGLQEGSGSRSSLLWECRRAIETKRPSFLLLENVAALASKKFMPDFQRWIDTYNQCVNDIAGTIKARVNANCMYFVSDEYEPRRVSKNNHSVQD